MAINLKDAKNGDKFQTVTGHTVVYHQDENKLEYKFPANVWVYEDALWILELFVQILLNLPMEILEKYLTAQQHAVIHSIFP